MRANPAALRVIRERTGMKVTALAVAAGIDRSNLTHIESGRRRGTPDQLVAIARALDVPVTAITIPEHAEAVA